MPIELHLTEAYLFVRMYDVVSYQEFLDYVQKAEELELQQQKSFDRIADLTAVQRFDVRYEEIFQLADRRNRQLVTRPVRTAIIAQAPLQIGMAHMFQTVSANETIQIQVVHSLEEAVDWIGLPSLTAMD